MLIMNCCNDTMLGKIYLIDEDGIEIKMFDNMYTTDKEDEVIYRKSSIASNLMVEGLSEDNPTAFGEQFLNLPSFTLIASDMEKHIDLFLD